MLLKRKKGSLQDLIFIGTVLLFFAFIVLIMFKISSEFNSSVQASSSFDSYGKTASSKLTGYYSGVMDNVFLFFTIGLMIAMLILAALIRVHPIFLVFFIVGWILAIFFAGIFSNIYTEAASNAVLSTQANQLTFIGLILGYLPIITAVFGVLLMIVIYKTWSVQ